jgi:quercetin dioxygenase-like cupin family protein
MARRRGLVLAFVVLALALTVASRRAPAQDPAQVNASSIKVRFENNRVRVLESTLRPGEKENMHSHPASTVYIISGGKIRNHLPDGTATEAELKTGDVLFREPLTHWTENIGTTTLHVVLVELKNPG